MKRSVVSCLIAASMFACAAPEETPPAAGGDAARGRLQMGQYGCGECHVVPGVRRAVGTLGPSLEGYAHRVYIAGELPNQPEVLVRWLQDPPALVPDTLMPDQDVHEIHARDMGAYLMSLR
jgi:cytochrome c1